MVEVSIPQEFPEKLTDPYRERAQRVLEAIGVYDGSEDRYRGLMDSLISLEQWMLNTFGNGAANLRRLPDETERAITAHYSPDQDGHSIGDMLDIARDHFSRLMEGKNSPEEVIRELPILRVQLERTLLPPGEQPGPQTGSGEGLRPPEFAPRLQLLIEFLQQHGIFTDDLVVVTGINAPTMMRAESYALVEIPRIEKEVLVCNQVGEATFAAEKMLGRDLYSRSTKEELIGYPGIHRIVFRDQGQWEADLETVLFSEGNNIGRKINVRDREEVRRVIIEKYTPKQWVAFTRDAKRKFEINGLKIGRIGSLFGIENAAFGIGFLELGEKVFGTTAQIVQEHLVRERARKMVEEAEREQVKEKLRELGSDPEKWREEIQAQYSVEEWIAFSDQDLDGFKIYTIGIFNLGAIFGIKSAKRSCLFWLQIGAKIYGEQNPKLKPLLDQEREIAQYKADLGKDPQKWIAAVREKVTSVQWASWKKNSRRKGVVICGHGLHAIAKILGVEGAPANNALPFWELGGKIFGEDDPHIAEPLRKARTESELSKRLGNDLETWRVEARKQFPTLQEWHAVPRDDRRTIRIGNKKLQALVTLFGLKGDPTKTDSLYTALGERMIRGNSTFQPVVTEKQRISLRSRSTAAEIHDDPNDNHVH
jgi:hypothetical protein